MYHDNSSLPSFRSISKNEEATKIDIWTVWAIGVGSAMGGVFFGWEFVLYGGFISGLFGVIYAAIFYSFYAQIITELSVRYQTSGGSFDFVMDALGIRPAILVAIMNMLKLICANAATALAISSYMTSGGLSSSYRYLVWVCIYGVFTTLDCIGIKQSSIVQVMATVLCLGIVVFYVGSNLSIFNGSNLLEIPSGTSKISSIYLFFKGLPFAVQFFDGFEEIPLLFSYTKNAETAMPTAISACYFTIFVIALGVLISASGSVDVDVLLDSEAPLMVGIETVYGEGSLISNILAYLIVIGLLVNFFAFVVFTSQQLQAIAEANLLPRMLAYREITYGAPVVASLCAMVVGLAVTTFFDFIMGAEEAQNTLLMASMFPSMICYLLVLQCVVRIRQVEIHSQHNFGHVTPREQRILGQPIASQFFVNNAVFVARFSQFMVVALIVALFILATKSFEYLYGMLLFTVVAVLMYLVMIHRARFDIRDEAKMILREKQQLEALIMHKQQQYYGGTEHPVAMGIGRIILEGHDPHSHPPPDISSPLSHSAVGVLVDLDPMPVFTDRAEGQIVDPADYSSQDENDADSAGEENTPFLSRSSPKKSAVKTKKRVKWAEGEKDEDGGSEEDIYHNGEEENEEFSETNPLFGWLLNTSSSNSKNQYQTIR